MTAKIKSIPHPYKARHRHKPRGISPHKFERVYWPYLPMVLITTLVLAFSSQSGVLQAAVRHPVTEVLDYATSMSINGLLQDTNAARAASSVSSLNLNSRLDAAAQAQANDMAARNYWSHYTPEGNPPWIFVNAQGYSYQKLGQNLATGFNDEQSTVNGWMASPSHRENLLDPSFSDVGFGFANCPNYTAAGGGPMTIIVAFYGTPQVAAAQTNAPPAVAPTAAPPASKPAAPAAAASSAPTSQPTTQPSAADKPKTTKPTTTETTSQEAKGVSLSFRTSRAQVAFAKLPVASFATGLASFGIFAAAALWIMHHAWAFRRALKFGEAFVFTHPLVDVGLVTLAALSFLLTQTAGFIQ